MHQLKLIEKVAEAALLGYKTRLAGVYYNKAFSPFQDNHQLFNAYKAGNDLAEKDIKNSAWIYKAVKDYE